MISLHEPPAAGNRATRARTLPLLAVTAALAALGYLAAVDPDQPGHYPLCPIRAVTGWYCPGCGGLRSVHAMLHGDLRTALHDNVAIWLAVPVLAAALRLWRVGRWSSGRVAMTYSVSFGVLIGFAVLRNLPGLEYLHP